MVTFVDPKKRLMIDDEIFQSPKSKLLSYIIMLLITIVSLSLW